MEEKPPPERRGAPRARSARPAFSAPEPPEPEEKPVQRAPRRAAKAAPAVTFQPPSAEDHPGGGTPAGRASGSQGNSRKPRQQGPAAEPSQARDIPAQTGRHTPKPAASRPNATQPAAPTSGPTGTQPAAKTSGPTGTQPTAPVSGPAAEPPVAEPSSKPAKAAAPSRARRKAPAASNEPGGGDRPADASAPISKAKKATPAKKAAPKKAAPKKATPAKRSPRKAAPTKTAPAKTAPTTTTPLGPTPASTEPPATPESATEATTPPDVTKEAAPHTIADETAPHTIRKDPWSTLLSDPAHAPEHLALAAVQTLGPRAQTWLTETKAAYPTATPHALARLATQTFTRPGRLTSVVGAVAGSFAPAALTVTAALTHAELVLHLAAAYGQNPTDQRRAADLLVITGAHPTMADAEAALAAAAAQPGGGTDEGRKNDGGEDDGREEEGREAGSGKVWRFGRMLAIQSGLWAAVRLVNRYLPGTSLLAAALTVSSSTHAVATRANAHYSQRSRDPGRRTDR